MLNERMPEIGRTVKHVPLTRGYVAIVDADDYERIAPFKWKSLIATTGTVYACRRWRDGETKKTRYEYMHRFILDAPPGMEVDHRNGVGLDNRKENLRLATHQENMRNRRIHKNNTSGYKGVFWSDRDKRWIARIKLNGKAIYLGSHGTAEEAHVAYCSAALRYYGTFARVS